MGRLIALAILSSNLLILGCSEPRADGSSEEKLKTSFTEMRAKLADPSKVEKLDEALKLLTFSDIQSPKDLFALNPQATADALRAKVNGKTADEIISAGERIKAARKEKEHQQAISEIKELEDAIAKAKAGQEKLAGFKVLRSRFYKRADSYREQPVIELTVKNELDSAVSRAYFKGTLASPNRSVPWLTDNFNYDISGGIEPGEQKDWSLAPNMFSDWGKVEAPSDAILTVEVVRVDGANKEALYSSTDLFEEKQKRLDELKKGLE